MARMFILIDKNTARLEQPEDTKRFHVQAAGGLPDDAIRASLSSFGTFDGTHAWISPDALRAAAAGRVGADWARSFEAMVGYATSKGWVNVDGHLRAHLERSS